MVGAGVPVDFLRLYYDQPRPAPLGAATHAGRADRLGPRRRGRRPAGLFAPVPARCCAATGGRCRSTPTPSSTPAPSRTSASASGRPIGRASRRGRFHVFAGADRRASSFVALPAAPSSAARPTRSRARATTRWPRGLRVEFRDPTFYMIDGDIMEPATQTRRRARARWCASSGGRVGEQILGVIGGSGLYEMDGLDATSSRVRVDDAVRRAVRRARARPPRRRRGSIFLPRHGRGHRLLPSRAQLPRQHLRAEAARRRVAASPSARSAACARRSRPGHLVVPDQFIDRTVAPAEHVLRQRHRRARRLRRSGLPVLARRASTRRRARPAATVHARRHLRLHGRAAVLDPRRVGALSQWGADIIGMTNLQEAKLAREAEICFATLALATDYDCWKPDARRRGDRRRAARPRGQRRPGAARRSPTSSPRLPATRACACATRAASTPSSPTAPRIPARVEARPDARHPLIGKYLWRQ